MKKLTIDQVLAMDPCEKYDRERITELAAGRNELSLLEILDLDIPHEDKIWVVLRKEFLSERDLHLLACDFAEYSLPIWEKWRPDDTRVRNAIAVKRKWINGDATDEELAAAGAAARAAIRAAAGSAAGDAAWAAARDAIRDAAGAAARAAAWDAAWEHFLEKVKEFLLKMEERESNCVGSGQEV